MKNWDQLRIVTEIQLWKQLQETHPRGRTTGNFLLREQVVKRHVGSEVLVVVTGHRN